MNQQTPLKGRALVVHDDVDVRDVLAQSMHRAGYAVDFATSATEALEKARQTLPSVVLSLKLIFQLI